MSGMRTILGLAVTALLAATLTIVASRAPAFAVGNPVPGDPLKGTGSVTRSVLTAAQLTSSTPTGTVADSAFALPANAAPPAHEFQGTLTLNNLATSGGYSVIKDTYGYAAASTAQHLPAMSLQFVQNGSHLIPVNRGLQITGNASWNYIVSPGRVWSESGDSGRTRAAFPFALVERNANCVHNGTMTFLFDGTTNSQVRYQVTQETCEYFKLDLWGQVSATYSRTTIPNAATIASDYAAEVGARIPTKPVAALATDYPAAGIDVSKLGSGVAAAHMTTYGFYYGGVNYVSTCGTRQGTYAFCGQMVLPSYSTAKTMFGTVAQARLAQLYGTGVGTQLVKTHVAEASGTAWNNVTFDNAADMATGNYTSAGYEVDEAGSTMGGFFDAETFSAKMNVAATGFPRKVTPGTQWVYHTSDTFMLGRAQDKYLETKQGSSADIFDLLRDDVLKPIKTSAESWSSVRTDNSTTGQAFAGYGMFWTQDNIAKVARLMNNDNGRSPAGTQLLSTAVLDASMQKNAADRGLTTSGSVPFKYNNSTWARQYTSADDPSYTTPFWVPFMSGFGGITVAMMPNGATYYYFSDNNEFAYSAVVKEASKLAPMTGGGGGGGCTPAQLIGNGGFETGTAVPWTASAGVVDNRQTLQPARTGSWKAWLNGFGYATTETLSQTVTIPAACANATLKLYLHVDTAETQGVAYDTLKLEVVSGTTTTLATWSNLDQAPGYQLRSFNLAPYKGAAITLRLTGAEDYSLQTSFTIDDVTLDVS